MEDGWKSRFFQETWNFEVFLSSLSNGLHGFFHCFSFTAQVLKLLSVYSIIYLVKSFFFKQLWEMKRSTFQGTSLITEVVENLLKYTDNLSEFPACWFFFFNHAVRVMCSLLNSQMDLWLYSFFSLDTSVYV